LVQALSHAHAQGIVHRDLKPENILLSESGSDLYAKIADWGIARVVFANELSPEFTGTGDILGSPAYMSPEQCLGRQLDDKSDVYSLGCVMYEWLTGKSAFTGKTAFDCMRMHVELTPPQVSSLRSDLPSAVSALLAACMEKEPAARFGSGEELQRMIGMLCEGRFQEALKGIERRKKVPAATGGRRKLLAGVLSVCCLAAVSCLTLGAIRKEEPAMPVAVQQGKLPVSELEQVKIAPVSQLPQEAAFLQDMIYDFQRAAAVSTATGDKSAANAAGKLAQQAQTWFKTQDYPRPAEPSFHVVSFFSGEPLKKFDPRGTANVRVSCKGEQVILALFSYEEVFWNLTVDPGVQIKKIYVISQKPLHLKGAPSGVPVEEILDTKSKFHRVDLIGVARGDKPSEYAKLAGREPDTWQGDQDAGKKSWVVGPANPWWLAQRITTALKPDHYRTLTESTANFFPVLKHGALHANYMKIADGYIRNELGSLIFPKKLEKILPNANMPTSFGDGDPGPTDQPLKYNFMTLIEVPATRQFFSFLVGGDFKEVDPVSGKTADAPLPPATDSQYTDTAMCSTSDGRGLLLKDAFQLFECKDATNIKWDKLAKLFPKPRYKDQVLGGLANAPGERAFYSLYDTYPHAQEGYRFLRKFDRSGKVLAQVKLSRRVGTEMAGRFAEMQLQNFGRYLVVVYSTTDKSVGYQFPAFYYVIDPLTGNVMLSGPIKRRGG
jgi:hypothetical protein